MDVENKIVFPHALPGFNYSVADEDMFYEWILKIKCVIGEGYKGLEINPSNISDNDIINLIGLFKRYEFDLSQLDVIKNEENKHIFETEETDDNGEIERVYGRSSTEIIINYNMLVLTPLNFYSNKEEHLFFDWLKKIKCIKKIEAFGKNLYLHLSEKIFKKEKVFILYEEWRNLRALFKRFKFKNIKQLKKFKFIFECPLKIENQIKQKKNKKEINIVFKYPWFYKGADYYLFELILQSIVCCNYSLDDDFENKKVIFSFDTEKICDKTLKNFFALCDRYGLKKKSQLNIFINDDNKHLFIENGKKNKGKFQLINQLNQDVPIFFKKENKIELNCSPLLFYTEEDKNLFFKRIQLIKSIDSYEGIGPSVYLYFISNNIPEEDLISLMALFYRYELDNFNQLEIFKNKENEDIF